MDFFYGLVDDLVHLLVFVWLGGVKVVAEFVEFFFDLIDGVLGV